MEETVVVIVGAGPSGLALGMNLARMQVKTIILEKELEVTEDPRGIAIAGDAVRISYQLGIGHELVNDIGSDTGTLYFHHKSFRHSPYMNFDIKQDHLQQTVSNAINQFQPYYERALRSALSKFPSCQLRVGCTVTGRVEEDDKVVIEYLDKDNSRQVIRTSWLVGADGKRGIVRKKFLEPEGVIQQVGMYDHVSTWVAANLEIELPSTTKHPAFPLWKLGFSPEQIYELFWPSGFHFCDDPHRPAVSGRFGPKGARKWRHEYSIEEGDNLADPEAHFWTQFSSWLVIPGSQISGTLRGQLIEYPRDCVKVKRCNPFTFATKVVNRWFCRRTLLIGDAAHVFPPFGGQGIASGIRDAQALSWRLAFLLCIPVSNEIREKFLVGFANERRQVVDHATRITKLNGDITNQRNRIIAFIFRTIARLIWSVPTFAVSITRSAMGDSFRYMQDEGVFTIPARGGGWKLPQIWVRTESSSPELSDAVFIKDMSKLSLVSIARADDNREVEERCISQCLKISGIPNSMLGMRNVTRLCVNDGIYSGKRERSLRGCYYPCDLQDLTDSKIDAIDGYDMHSLKRRIGKDTRFVILRPDFYVHSLAANEEQLLENFRQIASYFGLCV